MSDLRQLTNQVPSTLIAAAMFPFNHGLYKEGRMQMFVSAGAGTFVQRIRLGSSNEINLLRLHPIEKH